MLFSPTPSFSRDHNLLISLSISAEDVEIKWERTLLLTGPLTAVGPFKTHPKMVLTAKGSPFGFVKGPRLLSDPALSVSQLSI